MSMQAQTRNNPAYTKGLGLFKIPPGGPQNDDSGDQMNQFYHTHAPFFN